MVFSSLRRFDVQANYAFALAFVSIAPLLPAVWLIMSRYNPDLRQIVYGAQGRFESAFLACIVMSVLSGAAAFALGWSSMGQRRNTRPIRSWIGFFLGGGVVTLDLILLVTFYMLRLKHPM